LIHFSWRNKVFVYLVPMYVCMYVCMLHTGFLKYCCAESIHTNLGILTYISNYSSRKLYFEWHVQWTNILCNSFLSVVKFWLIRSQQKMIGPTLKSSAAVIFLPNHFYEEYLLIATETSESKNDVFSGKKSLSRIIIISWPFCAQWNIKRAFLIRTTGPRALESRVTGWVCEKIAQM
jgi:hypothetical protein